MDTCKRMWSKDELSAAGSKYYRHHIMISDVGVSAELIYISSSKEKITMDIIAANTNNISSNFIFGKVTNTTGSYAVYKVDGMKNPYATEVYLYPLYPSNSSTDSIIIDEPKLFSDVVNEL